MNRFTDIAVSFKHLQPVYGYRAEEILPIEEALEPIKSQIHELPYYIEIAKKHRHFPSEHGLSEDQSAAVYIYTMEWGESSLYRVLNKALRSENRQALKIWFKFLKLLDTALEKLPIVKEVVWRGVQHDIGKDLTKDQVFTWWSFNSCSSLVGVIKGFIENGVNATLFVIEAIKGKSLSGYTAFENEDEVMLGMGTQFRVKSNPLAQPNGSYIVHLIEVDDQPMAATPSQTQTETEAQDQDASAQLTTSPSSLINKDTKWKQDGIILAGGHAYGNHLNQLASPYGIYVDDEHQCIYVADYANDRIVKWIIGAKTGEVVAGGNGSGNRMDQLKWPRNVLVDEKNDSLIICDLENNRVVRWPRGNGKEGQTIISNIKCHGLAMDNNGDLYVSDLKKDEVRRWKFEEEEGTLVAGGNGKGDQFNQLNGPTFLFVDADYSIYVSDQNNNRVMKWAKDVNEGIIVAGGQGQGDGLTQLSSPWGVIVDQLGQVYVADGGNNRVVCWSEGSNEGRVVLGGNGRGQQPNQFNRPIGLSFDQKANLYVGDYGNHRIQKFEIDST